ncbi:MAG: hypothetical protein GXP53_06995 [Deltaproteobacteria bacterium]|nr:hypothetical protein [Deltaproteobacteria bacterium]
MIREFFEKDIYLFVIQKHLAVKIKACTGQESVFYETVTPDRLAKTLISSLGRQIAKTAIPEALSDPELFTDI